MSKIGYVVAAAVGAVAGVGAVYGYDRFSKKNDCAELCDCADEVMDEAEDEIASEE